MSPLETLEYAGRTWGLPVDPADWRTCTEVVCLEGADWRLLRTDFVERAGSVVTRVRVQLADAASGMLCLYVNDLWQLQVPDGESEVLPMYIPLGERVRLEVRVVPGRPFTEFRPAGASGQRKAWVWLMGLTRREPRL